MSIRCKMRVRGVYAQAWGGAKVIFDSQYDGRLIDEDREFSKATPQATFEAEINNPEAIKQIVIGGYYYFDISPVPEAVAAEKGHAS